MVGFGRSFDAHALLPSQARQVVAQAAAIEAAAVAVKALAAARMAEATSWKGTGHRNAADQLAADTGMSGGAARDLLETGRRLTEQPQVAGAALSGKLSPQQTSLVASGTEADPASADRLIDAAGQSSLGELRQEVARTKAAHEDLEERRRRIHARRRLRDWTDPEGEWHLGGTGNPVEGAEIMAALEPIRDALFNDARREGRREHPDAYAFDALVELCKQHTAGATPFSPVAAGATAGATPSSPAPAESSRRREPRGAKAKLIFRIDYDTWLRGAPVDGETCELVGYGPISVSVIDDLLAAGDPFVTAVLTKGKALIGSVHLGRQPTAHQQTALEWLYPTCAASGCCAQARLQRDHEIDWAKTHYTVFEHLDLLCAHHHALKTRQNWALVKGRGKRAFVPPTDDRHPRRRPEEVRATGPP